MKIIAIALMFCIVLLDCQAQTKKVSIKKQSDKHVYESVDQIPAPEGGIEKLSRLIAKNLAYPNDCEQPGGKVVISFVVEANGKIDNETVVKDPCGKNHKLSNRLFSIVKKMKWNPGKLNGKAVATRYSLPIACMLPAND